MPSKSPQSDKGENWAMACHLSALLGFFGIPLGNIFGPLVFWLLKKNDFSFVDDQGKEALNFEISVTIYAIISGVLMMILIGFILLPIVIVFGLVFTIIASIQASNGVVYRYPFTIRFLK